MARKIVRMYISPEQKTLLERVCQTLGMHESEVLRYTFLEYTNHLGL
jgi:antitoxin component of RelBE/YafQ-DinJ toxin-antitoxin module